MPRERKGPREMPELLAELEQKGVHYQETDVFTSLDASMATVGSSRRISVRADATELQKRKALERLIKLMGTRREKPVNIVHRRHRRGPRFFM